MSSWACQSRSGNVCSSPNAALRGNVPITLNIYGESVPGPGGTEVPGALIKSVTQTFAIPYRPSTNLNKCPSGGWFKQGFCYSGKAFTIAFKLKPFKINLPETAVISIAYNTTHYGYNPIGESAPCYGTSGGCFYDSLNVGLGTTGVHMGSKPNPGTAWGSSTWDNSTATPRRPRVSSTWTRRPAPAGMATTPPSRSPRADQSTVRTGVAA